MVCIEPVRKGTACSCAITRSFSTSSDCKPHPFKLSLTNTNKFYTSQKFGAEKKKVPRQFITGGLAERGLHLNSKFESPSYLDVSWSVDDPTSSTGHAEVTVTWPPVD